MTCTNCGQIGRDGVSFCNGCGTALPLTAATAVGTILATPVQTTKPCPLCGEQIMQAAIRCRYCSSDLTGPRLQQGGIALNAPPTAAAQPSIVIQNVQASQPTLAPHQGFLPHQIKNPGIAMLLSVVIPGGGQFYNGHAGKGILILCTFWLIIPWVWGVFDAYSCANRINRVGF